MGSPASTTKDISIVLDTAKWRENPGFVETAVQLDHFVECNTCHRVIGVGFSHIEAVDDVTENQTGKNTRDGWKCMEHYEADDDAGHLTDEDKRAGLDGK